VVSADLGALITETEQAISQALPLLKRRIKRRSTQHNLYIIVTAPIEPNRPLEHEGITTVAAHFRSWPLTGHFARGRNSRE
jgi:hypothetical protein